MYLGRKSSFGQILFKNSIHFVSINFNDKIFQVMNKIVLFTPFQILTKPTKCLHIHQR